MQFAPTKRLNTYQISPNIFFVAPRNGRPPHMRFTVSQLLCFMLFLLFQDEFRQLYPMVVPNVLWLVLPFLHSFLQLISLHLQLALQNIVESLFCHLFKAPMVFKGVIHPFLDSKQYKNIEILIIVFIEIYILRMTSKTY